MVVILHNVGTEIYIYAVQQDTQSFLIIELYSPHLLARHVLDLTGPSSGAFVYKLYVQIWYVVILILSDTFSRYEVVGTVLVVFAHICSKFL